MRRLIIHIRYVLIVAVMIIATGSDVYGQSVELSRKLYDIYTEAIKKAKYDEGLVLADSLRRESIAEGSHDGEMLSYTIPVLNVLRNRLGADNLEKAMAPLKQKALEYNEMSYYYYAVSNMVYYLSNEGLYQSAIEYMKKERMFATKAADPYGLYVAYNLLGHLCQRRCEYVKAVNNYKMALEINETKHLNLEAESTHRQICVCYRESRNFRTVLDFTNEHLRNCKYESVRATLLTNKGFCLFVLGMDKDFIETYKEWKKINPSEFANYKGFAMTLNIFNDILEGRVKKAQKSISEMSESYDKRIMEISYYQRNKDYVKEMDCLRKLYIYQVMQKNVDLSLDVSDLSAVFNQRLLLLDKERDDYNNSQLELANAQLLLNNTELELEHAKNAKDMAQMTSARNTLTLNNQKLLSKRLKESLTTQQIQREANEREMRAHKTILLSILMFSMVFGIVVYLFYRKSKRMSNKLRMINEQFHQTLKEISKAKDEALEADRMKTKFLRDMNHEIRTPLNAIVGFSQVLVDMDNVLSDEEKEDVMARIAGNSQVLSALINDILDLTSIESGRYVMKEEDVDVNLACQIAMDSIRQRMNGAVRLQFRSTVPNGHLITSDQQRIICVLTNMLSNSEKNTTHGCITLECSLNMHPGVVTFVVNDTGVGVPRQMMDEIFERFSKADTFKQGTGLGLFICRTIAEKLGGEINIDKEYTGGARFWFTVPDRHS